MKVEKVEGGLVVPIPAEVAAQLNLKAGDEVVIRAAPDRALELQRSDDPERLRQRIEALARPLPPDWSFDRDEANAR